ncbi:MAG: hypothetical protein O3B86_13860, partial [Planctomycetota bacterium]|nr:hypothetical protein [Planctomycetota bacterium]
KGIGEDTVDLWVVPKARHNGARQTDQEGYDQRLAEFFGTLVPVQFADSTDKSTPVSEALT